MRPRKSRAELSSEQLARKRVTDKAWKERNLKTENRRKRAYEAAHPESRERVQVDPIRSCRVCHGPLSNRNQSGICARNHECRVRQQAERGRGGGRKNSPEALILPPAYEIDENGEELIGNDGKPIEIVDEVAIRIAVAGTRRVPLTEKERREAVKRMIQIGAGYREIANHIGTSPAKLTPLIEDLGYALLPRRKPGGHHREATEIRKVAR